MELEYCRPVTFHRHEGLFNVDLDGEVVRVSGQQPTVLGPDLRRVAGLQRALNFYALACTPQFERDGRKPQRTGYQGTMFDWASDKLNDLRDRMENARGLVIAPSIEMAKYFEQLIKVIDGESPIIVHSKTPNAEARIKAFRDSDKRWLVSVGMVSEGVDIPRLRVLIYLSSALTELSFRQAIGRVVRSNGLDDDTRAYVVMPSFDILEAYARKIENEMSPGKRRDPGEPKSKKCPVCRSECSPSDATCAICDFEFPVKPKRLKNCDKCGAPNRVAAKNCENCGQSFKALFHLTLEEALRAGVITRGMDIGEEEVREGEALAADLRAKILKSGDEHLLRLLKTFPEESFGRLKNILKEQ